MFERSSDLEPFPARTLLSVRRRVVGWLLAIVGLPLLPFLFGGVWLMAMMGVIIVSFTLGRVLLRRLGLVLPPLATALFSLWLLFVTCMLPYVGWLVGGVAAAVGFGALLQTRFGSRQRWSQCSV